MLAVKREVLEILLKDEEFVKELNGIKSKDEAVWVLLKHAKKHGFKVKVLEPGGA